MESGANPDGIWPNGSFNKPCFDKSCHYREAEINQIRVTHPNYIPEVAYADRLPGDLHTTNMPVNLTNETEERITEDFINRFRPFLYAYLIKACIRGAASLVLGG